MANHMAGDGRSRFDTLRQLNSLITETYSAEIWQAVKAGLAVACALSIKGRTNPLAVVFEGPSGRGKSTIINMFAPERPEMEKYLYRLDGFTSKSFVSHAANRTPEELAKIDLLPKVKDKLLVTKELAPLFRGKEDTLRENFAIIAAVLDGKGHLSASGVHGTRGYEGEFVFNWLGGTTPIPPATDAIMSQLGNRLLRYEIIGEPPSEVDLMEFAANYTAGDMDKRCKELVNRFLKDHFEEFPVNSIEPGRIPFTDAQRQALVRAAQFTAKGRVEAARVDALDRGGISDYVAGEPEGPQRVILLLRTFLAGFSLIERGDPAVTNEALELALHMAFSSIPARRRKTIRALLTNGGKINTPTLSEVVGVSQPTARDMMKELAATGIAKFKRGVSQEADAISLGSDWAWLLAQSVESETNLCEEETIET